MVRVTFSPEAAGALLALLAVVLPAAGTAPGAQAASSVAKSMTTAITFDNFLDISKLLLGSIGWADKQTRTSVHWGQREAGPKGYDPQMAFAKVGLSSTMNGYKDQCKGVKTEQICC